MRKASLGTIFLTVFLDLLGFGLVVPYLPGVAREHGASPLVATLLGAVYSAMQFLFVPFWGHLSDRAGRRPILLGSIAATAVGMVVLGSVGSLAGLFAARIFVGIATANIAVAAAYIADVTKPEDRARGMGLIGVAIGLGFVLGPVLGGLLAEYSPIHRVGAVPAYAAAALSAVNLVLAARFLPESLPPDRRGANVRSASPFDARRLRVAFAIEGVPAALLVQFVVVLSFSGLEQTFRLFTADAFGLGNEGTGYILGVQGLVLILVQVGLLRLLVPVSNERTLVRTGVLVEALGFFGVAMAPVILGGSRPTLVAGMAVIALGSGLVNPSLSALVSRLASSDGQGLVLGVHQSSGALARVFGPAVGGMLYQSFGPRAPYAAAAIGMLLAACASLALRKPAPRGDDPVVPQPAGTA
jgi:DHA1 family tetracycline resistance protein-like MFS transporter